MEHLDILKKLQEEQNVYQPEEPAVEEQLDGVTITEDTEVKGTPPHVVDEVQEEAIEAQLAKEKTSTQEEANLVVTSKADLEAIIKDIVKAYDVKIDAATDRIDELSLTIEMHEKKADAAAGERSVIKVTPRHMNVPDHMSILAEANMDKLKGKIGRFVTNRPDMRSLRRFQGYEPVIGDNGKEVRYMDGVLMGITKGKHKEEIQKPRDERKRFRAESIGTRFKEDAAKAGVEVIGDGITYDDEYDSPSEK